VLPVTERSRSFAKPTDWQAGIRRMYKESLMPLYEKDFVGLKELEEQVRKAP
jgi:hypothetical protein